MLPKGPGTHRGLGFTSLNPKWVYGTPNPKTQAQWSSCEVTLGAQYLTCDYLSPLGSFCFSVCFIPRFVGSVPRALVNSTLWGFSVTTFGVFDERTLGSLRGYNLLPQAQSLEA